MFIQVCDKSLAQLYSFHIFGLYIISSQLPVAAVIKHAGIKLLYVNRFDRNNFYFIPLGTRMKIEWNNKKKLITTKIIIPLYNNYVDILLCIWE